MNASSITMPEAPVVPGRRNAISCVGCVRAGQCMGASVDQGSGSGCMTQLSLAKGEHLFRAGDPVVYQYIVSSGAVKSYSVTREGDEQVLGFHLPCDVVGLDATGRDHFIGNALAITATRVCRMPVTAIRRRVDESSGFRDELLELMAQEIQRLHRALHIGRQGADRRVAAFLLGQVRRQDAGAGHATELRLHMSRADIGRYLGLTTETVSRVFSRLQESGAIRCRGSEVRVLDLELLLDLA